MKSLPALPGIIAAVGLAILALSFFAPLPIPYYQDFSVMYFTVKALLSGIPIYAYADQLSFIKNITPPDFTFHPYPYPPWYALVTIFIGFLPIQVAARMWFFLNISMLSLAAWLLTPGWKNTWRILAVLAAIMFLPAFGLLVVGQYSTPVLLGAALFVHAARRQSSWELAAALLLMTFKPHIGGLFFLAGFFWLVKNRSPFQRRALILTLAGGMLLAAVGFLADPAWPLAYFQSLSRYRDLPGVQTCGQCASFSVALVRVITGQSNTITAAVLSLVMAVLAGLLLFWRYRGRLEDPVFLMSIFAALTLLLDPYLLNYDYILLLLPLFWLVRQYRLAWLLYIAPWAALAPGWDGNILLALTALVTFILILRASIDLTPGASYNHNNN